jgi:hypothetical protein
LDFGFKACSEQTWLKNLREMDKSNLLKLQGQGRNRYRVKATHWPALHYHLTQIQAAYSRPQTGIELGFHFQNFCFSKVCLWSSILFLFCFFNAEFLYTHTLSLYGIFYVRCLLAIFSS